MVRSDVRWQKGKWFGQIFHWYVQRVESTVIHEMSIHRTIWSFKLEIGQETSFCLPARAFSSRHKNNWRWREPSHVDVVAFCRNLQSLKKNSHAVSSWWSWKYSRPSFIDNNQENNLIFVGIHSIWCLKVYSKSIWILVAYLSKNI